MKSRILHLVYYLMQNNNGIWEAPRVGRYRKVGERVTLNGKPYKVIRVTYSRASCEPVGRKRVKFTHAVTGKQYDFMAKDGRRIDICPTVG